MGMQYDVKAATLPYSGYLVKFPTRVKGISVKAGGTGASVVFFDTVTDPVTATYAKTANTITVTKNGHGLQAGQNIGLTFTAAGGVSGTAGNYVIATATTNTFTVTDINSGTVTGGTACLYAPKWIMTFVFADGDIYTNYWLLPGEGIRVDNGVHSTMANVTASTIFYG